MVFDRPQQAKAARASVNCFFSQSWPNKELVIFNATPHSIIPWWRRWQNFNEIRLKARFQSEMLALCVENANGEWVVNWLPDCWYHADYVTSHMRHRGKDQFVLFRHKHVYALKDRKLVVVSNESVTSWSFYRHFPVNFEKPLIDQFNRVVQVDNPANLIVKFAREII